MEYGFHQFISICMIFDGEKTDPLIAFHANSGISCCIIKCSINNLKKNYTKWAERLQSLHGDVNNV
jgi:hypothetical protein